MAVAAGGDVGGGDDAGAVVFFAEFIEGLGALDVFVVIDDEFEVAAEFVKVFGVVLDEFEGIPVNSADGPFDFSHTLNEWLSPVNCSKNIRHSCGGL